MRKISPTHEMEALARTGVFGVRYRKWPQQES